MWAADNATGSKCLGFCPGALEQELGQAPGPVTKQTSEPLDWSSEIFNSAFGHKQKLSTCYVLTMVKQPCKETQMSTAFPGLKEGMLSGPFLTLESKPDNYCSFSPSSSHQMLPGPGPLRRHPQSLGGIRVFCVLSGGGSTQIPYLSWRLEDRSGFTGAELKTPRPPAAGRDQPESQARGQQRLMRKENEVETRPQSTKRRRHQEAREERVKSMRRSLLGDFL